MNYAHYIKALGVVLRRDQLERDDAALLYGAMLDGGVPDVEL
jgi:hypothetical protein